MENNEVKQEQTVEKQQETQQEQPKQTEDNQIEQKEDRHEQVYPYTNETISRDIQELLEKQKENTKLIKQIQNSLPMPSGLYTQVLDFFQKVEKYVEENGEDSITDKERLMLEDIRQSSMYTFFQDMFAKNINRKPDNFVNEVHYSNKTIVPKVPKFTNNEGNEISGPKAINMFRSLVSIGELIQLPLWHSGFWVLIKPPTQAEIVNLQTALTENEIILGRETNTLVYSNYSVVTNRILTEFIINHINQTSIKGWENLDLREYISVHDFYILTCGMLSTMSPEGVNIVRYCSNASRTDDSGKPLCDFFVTGNVDPKKLIWVNRKAITTNMLSHMMNNKFNETMTTDMVKDYQLGISSCSDKTVDVILDNGKTIQVTFGIPNLRDYLTNGEAWVEEIKSAAEAMFTDTDNKDQKNAKVNNLSAASILGIYNTFVKEFKLPSGEIIKDFSTFKDILGDLSLDDSGFTEFISKLSDYISESPIAIVATPTYTCPKCNKQQKEGDNGPFKEFIPLDVVSHFFALCGLRSRIVQQRSF